MIEYVNIYLKKTKCWSADAVAQDHYTNYWAVTETETRSEHSQTFKMECFAKGKMPECRCATKNFSGQGGRGLWN